MFTHVDGVPETRGEPNGQIGFFMPYEAECNPHYEEVRQHSAEWVDKFGLAPSEKDRRRLALGDYALLCAYFLPRASRDQLALASDWITWEFILDDLFSDTFQSGRNLDGARAAVSHFVPLLPVQPPRIPSPRNPIECGLSQVTPV